MKARGLHARQALLLSASKASLGLSASEAMPEVEPHPYVGAAFCLASPKHPRRLRLGVATLYDPPFNHDSLHKARGACAHVRSLHYCRKYCIVTDRRCNRRSWSAALICRESSIAAAFRLGVQVSWKGPSSVIVHLVDKRAIWRLMGMPVV